MIISVDVGKWFYKIKHLFMIKIATILEINRNSLLCKKVSMKPTEKIILNGKVMKTLIQE